MSFDIFGFSVPLYGVLFWLGILAAAAVAIFLFKKREIPLFDLVCSAIYTIIGAIIGAKLLFFIVSFSEIVEGVRAAYAAGATVMQIVAALMQGGFVFYGGLIGGILGLLIYCWQFKMPVLKFFDIYAVVLPFGHAFGRVGCFFGGCCYGMPYDGIFSYKYFVSPENGGAPGLLGESLFPVQLFEAFFLLVIFAAQMLIFYKKPKPYGILVVNYGVLYAITRFVLEFFRYDAVRGVYGGLSTSQWISIALILGAGALVLLYYLKQRKVSTVLNNEHKENT